jgi:D-lactate dehydrogenase
MNQIKADLKLSPIPAAVFAHPVCSSQKMGNGHHLIELAKACAGSVETSMEGFCCGMAGDRGLQVPELPRHAVKTSTNPGAELGVSSSRTCEMGLKENTGLEFISMEELVMRSIANST